ncbi:toll/interleukin-1 receptor domain-containing protein [Hyphomonas sp.]|uniref:toll/interleukin-1 receptor domain-containing protein n=1 Tax=Hyphomonas sp. TaxID=87 RepID=UPI0039189328
MAGFTDVLQSHVERAERTMASSPLAQQYEEVYGRVTPYVLLPMPVGMSWNSFRGSGVLERIGHLIITGRVKAFDVHVGERCGRAAGERSAKWKRELFGKAFFQPPANGSPWKPKRLCRIVEETVAEAHWTLERWAERFTLFRTDVGAHAEGQTPTMLGHEPPCTFLSYSSHDLQRVSGLAHAVASVGPQLWFDRKSLADGEDWIDGIKRGLSHSERLVAFCSADYYASFPRSRELKVFSGLKRPVLPVALDCAKPRGAAKRKFYRLQHILAAQLEDEEVTTRIVAWLERQRQRDA